MKKYVRNRIRKMLVAFSLAGSLLVCSNTAFATSGDEKETSDEGTITIFIGGEGEESYAYDNVKKEYIQLGECPAEEILEHADYEDVTASKGYVYYYNFLDIKPTYSRVSNPMHITSGYKLLISSAPSPRTVIYRVGYLKYGGTAVYVDIIGNYRLDFVINDSTNYSVFIQNMAPINIDVQGSYGIH